MQGGRDKLGWVRQLVKYTETHPIYIADSASSAVEVLQNGSIQKTVFPSLKPNRREDALLLQQWLADMMAQLTANAPSSPADQASASATCNKGCHTVCTVAVEREIDLYLKGSIGQMLTCVSVCDMLLALVFVAAATHTIAQQADIKLGKPWKASHALTGCA